MSVPLLTNSCSLSFVRLAYLMRFCLSTAVPKTVHLKGCPSMNRDTTSSASSRLREVTLLRLATLHFETPVVMSSRRLMGVALQDQIGWNACSGPLATTLTSSPACTSPMLERTGIQLSKNSSTLLQSRYQTNGRSPLTDPSS